MSNSDVIRAIINAHIKTNRKQEITGKILNSVLNQMVTDKDAGISEEAKLRTAEDERIEGLINKEIVDRESADAEIQDALTKEIAARQEGDTAISNALSEERTARENADTNINNALAEEISARQEGDTSLLNAIRDAFSKGYLFAGVATTDTNPGTPEGKVFYIANGKGIYTNFGRIEVTEDEVVVLYYDTEWHKVATGIASNSNLTALLNDIDNVKTDVDNVKDVFNAALEGKQDTISDLDAIRQGAQKGSTALQSESDPVYLADKPSLALKTEIPDISGKADKSELSSVATSGFYDDLINKPIIPSKTSELTNDSGYLNSIPEEYVTETELNSKGYLTEHQDISGKADKATTLAGYGIANAYTKQEVDMAISSAITTTLNTEV